MVSGRAAFGIRASTGSPVVVGLGLVVVGVGVLGDVVGLALVGTSGAGGGVSEPLEQAVTSRTTSPAAYVTIGLGLETGIGVPWGRPVTATAEAATRRKTLSR